MGKVATTNRIDIDIVAKKMQHSMENATLGVR